MFGELLCHKAQSVAVAVIVRRYRTGQVPGHGTYGGYGRGIVHVRRADGADEGHRPAGSTFAFAAISSTLTASNPLDANNARPTRMSCSRRCSAVILAVLAMSSSVVVAVPSAYTPIPPEMLSGSTFSR